MKSCSEWAQLLSQYRQSLKSVKKIRENSICWGGSCHITASSRIDPYTCSETVFVKYHVFTFSKNTNCSKKNVTYTQRNVHVSSSADLPECVLWCKNAKYPCYPWETFGSTGLAVHLFFQIIDTRGMSWMQTAWWLLIFSVKILLALTSLVINVLDNVKARTHMSSRR